MARSKDLEISDAAYSLMLRYFLRSRQLRESGFLPNALNVLLKISLGFARLSLRRREVTEDDAVMAIKLYEDHVTTLGEPGLAGGIRIANLAEGHRCDLLVQQNSENLRRFAEKLRNYVNGD